jgi:hypothetical protein
MRHDLFGQIATAQQAFATDWIKAYRLYIEEER